MQTGIRYKERDEPAIHLFQVTLSHFISYSDSDIFTDYTFRLSENREQRVQERKKYEKEVEILTKVQTTMGFPAAPEIKSLTAAELASDLQEMGVGTSRPRLTNVVRY